MRVADSIGEFLIWTNQKIHVSWILASACIGIVIGVLAAKNWPYFASYPWLLTGISAVMAASTIGRTWLVIVAILGGVVVGIWRGSVVQSDIAMYQGIIGESVIASGTVGEDIDVNKSGQSVIRLSEVNIGGKAYAGSVWVTTSDASDIRRSDKLMVEGIMTDGFGSFVASIYSARVMGVHRPNPGDIALNIRDYFATGVHRALSDTQASLGLGYLVGQRRSLPEDLVVSLQAAGLTHIVVASGYNLTILVRLARRLFEKVSKYLSLVTSAGMIAGFIAITGMSPSMSRAGLVAGLSLLAWYYGRRFHPIILLSLAMAITLLVQPSYGWGDLGWQLSFAAFGGVMILAPLLQVYFFGDITERPLRRIFIETIAATISTLPILVGSFGQFSIVAPLANMLVLPFVPLAMLLTFLAGTAGLLLPGAAIIIGFPAELLLWYMVGVAEAMGSLPFAAQEFELPSYGVFVSYILLTLACLWMSRVTRYDLRRSSLVE